MNYKLINKETNEEHICTRVEIDGFEYYVSDGIAKNGDRLYLLRDSLLGNSGDIIKVVSTSSINSRTDIIKANGDTHWFASDTEYQRKWEWKLIIATNNPSIDIPKVEDAVEELAKIHANKVWGIYVNDVDEDSNDTRGGNSESDFKAGYKQSQSTHPYSEKDMIEFAEWCLLRKWNFNGSTKTWWSELYAALFPTTKELLQVFKDQQTKTIYFR